MVCVSVVVLSQASVNDQVLVMTASLAQSPLATASVNVACKSVEQLSASSATSPVSVKSLASWSHSIVRSAGTVKVGAVVSTTVMVCDTEDEFPQSSVKVQVLIIITLQEFELSITSIPVTDISSIQLSLAVKLPGARTSSIHWKVISLGAFGVIGFVVSIILKVAVDEAELPQPSIAVNITVAEPVWPQSSESDTKLFVQVIAEQLSEAIAPPLDVNQIWRSCKVFPLISHSTVSSVADTVITGGVVSCIA